MDHPVCSYYIFGFLDDFKGSFLNISSPFWRYLICFENYSFVDLQNGTEIRAKTLLKLNQYI